MGQAVQRTQFQIGHGDVGIVARGREHGEGLDVNVGDVFLAGEGVRADCVSKRVDDEVGITAGCLGFAKHLRADLNRMGHHVADLFDEVEARVVEAAA